MRTLTIAAIKQLENKEPIPSFTGRTLADWYDGGREELKRMED